MAKWWQYVNSRATCRQHPENGSGRRETPLKHNFVTLLEILVSISRLLDIRIDFPEILVLLSNHKCDTGPSLGVNNSDILGEQESKIVVKAFAALFTGTERIGIRL